MPYKITGKVLGEDGYPLQQIAQINEINVLPGLPRIIANTWSDPDTGDFTFFALNENSIILVESLNFHPQTFTAKAVPSVVKLKVNAVEIVGYRKKKEPNYLWLIIAGFVGVVTIAANSGKKKPQATAKAAPEPKKVKV